MTKKNNKNAKKYVIIQSGILCSGFGLAKLTLDVTCFKVLRDKESITKQKLSLEHTPRLSYVTPFFSFVQTKYFEKEENYSLYLLIEQKR